MSRQTVLVAGLYVVSTPIGNLRDITLRALDILQGVDCIACEDTRVTCKLLQCYDINRPMISCHEYNERERLNQIMEKIRDGCPIALVSDAGTPTISDPGFRLVRECQRQHLAVFSIPGPSAFVAALSISGLPTDRFLFIGFFPQKISARRQLLEQHKFSTHTLIAYESCHRIAKLVEDIISILGEHYYVAIAREITKMHELVHIGTAIDVQKQLRENGYRGEFVILIARQEFHL